MKATEITAGLAESNSSLLPGLWRDSLHVTCGLTACTLGSAPGPTLGNDYGKTLLYLLPLSFPRLPLLLHTVPCITFPTLLSFSPLSQAGRFVEHCKLPTLPGEKIENQLQKLEGTKCSWFHGSHRDIATMVAKYILMDYSYKFSTNGEIRGGMFS